jgi:hypothetical protein
MTEVRPVWHKVSHADGREGVFKKNQLQWEGSG